MGKWSKDLLIFDIPEYKIQAHWHENSLGGKIYGYDREAIGETNPGLLFDLIMAAKAGGKEIKLIDVANKKKKNL